MYEYDRHEERTGFQEARDYDERTDIQADFVMVYGLRNLKERIKHWKSRGYVVHLMTGISWGGYQDYLYGRYDGIDHHDEGQVGHDGNEINHGRDVPYMVPSVSFSKYLADKLRSAVDAGVEAIHLEEPEFWADAGYSEAFKREWMIYYKEPWSDPQASCDAQYKASKLKQYLYRRTLDRLCSELKEYAMSRYGRFLRFYVPTHSLINYSQWKIVSPESSLIDIPSVDGYIAQIWTGTSRVPNRYRGTLRERTFETAFLEYGIMQELVRGTGRRMWFLHDPIEDNPKHTWKDYRENYYRTVVASLLHPEISSYEVAPWPNRIFNGSYPNDAGTGTEEIPDGYRTNLLTVMHTLRDMKTDDTEWISGTGEIGIIMSDSCMFQRIYPVGDPYRETSFQSSWDPFFGLALPLLKSGICVRPVQFENIGRFPGYLDRCSRLVLSYEFMKPETPDAHNVLAQWVRKGGSLIYIGDGADPFHRIRHWWNSGRSDYNDPAEHLFEAMGLPGNPEEGIHPVGRGSVAYMRVSPKNIASDGLLCDRYTETVKSIFRLTGDELVPSGHFLLRRGRYMISAVLDESVTSVPVRIKGRFIDMFRDDLPAISDPEPEPGSVGLFLDTSMIDRTGSSDILAVSGRISGLKQGARSLSCKILSPAGMTSCMRVWTRRKPKSATARVNGHESDLNISYDEDTGTAFLTFESSPSGAYIKIRF